MGSMAKRETMLTKHGFIRAEPIAEAAPCEVCGRKVSGARMWCRKCQGECESYCRSCAQAYACLAEMRGE